MVKAEIALEFYAALHKASKLETIEGTKIRVFRGKVVEDVWDELGKSRSYYSKVSKALIECGAIQVIQKGNSHQDTVIALHGKPDPSSVSWALDLTNPKASSKLPVRQPQKGGAQVEERLSKIEQRLDALEGK